jgi:predicted DNA binding CopG/RHH family protein
MPRPGPVTPKRSIRVSDDKWAAVKAKAAAEGKTVSDVINECLDVYLSGETTA